jgi:8-oxo-dGTP pyrophosphatase MutT (NUDIX family)
MTAMQTNQPPVGTAEEGARPAATLILMRESDAARHVLMLQRADSMRFAAGALVFPGGALDEADYHLADALDHGLTREDAAARLAAIRETIEEAGVAVGLGEGVSPADVARMRRALHDGVTLADLATRHGLEIALDALLPFARWCPQRRDSAVPRLFDTRFYIARAPGDHHVASADDTENVRLRWSDPDEILRDCAAGVETALFPTRRNLERLLAAGGFDSMADFLSAYPQEMVSPWMEERDGVRHLCIQPNLGYPVTSEPLDNIVRG